jgi:acid phosphatase
MRPSIRVSAATLVLGLFLATFLAGCDPVRQFKFLAEWGIYNYSKALGTDPESGWEYQYGRIYPAREIRISKSEYKNNGQVWFGSNLVDRFSRPNGICRFRLTVNDFRAVGGLLFRYRNESNYYRLDFNTQAKYLVCVQDGKVTKVPLPENFFYIPPRQPTWVEVECRGPQFRVSVNGIERLAFTDQTHRRGKIGFFSGSGYQSFIIENLEYFSKKAPALDVKSAVLKAPYIYWCTGVEARVAWETSLPGTEDRVEYQIQDGHREGKPKQVKAQTNGLVHTAVLTGLEPGAVYQYRCFTDGLEAGGGSFRADPGSAAAGFTLGLIGDNRSRPDNFLKLNQLLAARNPDLVLNAGDIVEEGSRSDWDAEFFTPNQVIASRAPYLVSIGNHEDQSKYFSYYLPYPGTTPERGRYYSTVYGGVAILVFDDYAQGPAQTAWMEKTLASPEFRKADWRVVMSHQPAYSTGWEDYEGDAWKRGEQFLGLFKKYNVQFFLNGHTHSYERGLLNGTYHILSGGGGAGEENWGRAWDHVAVFSIILQYCTFSVTPQKIEMVCRDIRDSLVDRLVVEKGKPPVLDAAPVWAQTPPKTGTGDTLNFVVKTPKLGAKKLRYKISYDPALDSYHWTKPIPAFQEDTLAIRPGKSGTYRVSIVGMDEDGRLTRVLQQAVEYKAE